MTPSDTLRLSIDALRKDHSITPSAVAARYRACRFATQFAAGFSMAPRTKNN
jgi:hypothetical protein